MVTSAQVVETSVNVTTNSPSQDYTHPDDHNLPTYDMTLGFKPLTVVCVMLLTAGLRERYVIQKGVCFTDMSTVSCRR